MSKPKPSDKELKAREVENKDAKFRRIATPRMKRVIYELQRLENMPSQPTYEVLDVDAQKLVDALNKATSTVLALYGKIANGDSIKPTKKTEIEDIF
jgi:hypothetical protein